MEISPKSESRCRKLILLSAVLILSGAGCAEREAAPVIQEPEPEAALPIFGYAERRTVKAFGEYIEDRFTGYHAGDDVEYKDVNEEVPVQAISDGEIIFIGRTEGYGGLILIRHRVGGEEITAIYGHLDLGSASLKQGDEVKRGQFLANLGDHESEETDGERKHLHFGLYEGDDLRFAGYVGTPAEIRNWINPQDFFEERGLLKNTPSRMFHPDKERGGDIFRIRFLIPPGWEAEYVPSLQALNLFSLSGSGSARERSQVFVRYFDSANFLTLNTVNIHKVNDLWIGKKSYQARRYEITKKFGVPDFHEQPKWRNERHIVTDFRDKDGFTRYYVAAANPDLDITFEADGTLYETILKSMEIYE